MIVIFISHLCVVDRGEEQSSKPLVKVVSKMVTREVLFVKLHMGIV